MSGTRGLLLQVPPTLDAACLPGRVPLTLLGTPALADNNDWAGQAQRFFNNNQSSDRDAYERGREDEMRRQQAEQDRYRYGRNPFTRSTRNSIEYGAARPGEPFDGEGLR